MTVLAADRYEWVGSIETYTGKSVDLLNFAAYMVDINDISHSLSLQCRYNGHIPSFYSVAEHSVRVAWLLKTLREPPDVQLAGLLHDAAEAYVGDMVRPLKRVPEVGKAHQDLENKISDVILSTLGARLPMTSAVHAADKDMYYWEVKHIRTGTVEGWSPSVAKSQFLKRYHHLLADLRNGR